LKDEPKPSFNQVPLFVSLTLTSDKAHHLVPKSRGGVHTVYMHRSCHKQIHALFTEAELAKSYSNLESLCAHPELAKFIKWVKGKPNEFNPPIRRSRNKGSFNL
jgi:5-methylcytosine-specific restriction endonuclease McrA